MRIAVVGCGALGSFYGAKLCAIGEDVHFLLRSDYEVVRRQGVRIQSVHGDFSVRPNCARQPAEIGRCDLVVIGLKTTANTEFPRLLPPLTGPDTAVLTLQNGLGNEESLAELLEPERVLGGLCFVCLNRVAPGVIQHTAHGDIILGEYRRAPGDRSRQLAALFRRAGIRCELTENLEKTHWEKLIWNVPFNGLGVAGVAGVDAVRNGRLNMGQPRGPCLPTDQLLADPDWICLVRELMAEVIASARELGFEIAPDVAEERIERTRRMGAYKASTLIDYERGQALELESLFLEPLRRARAAGVPTPRLAALAQVLAELSRGKELLEPGLAGSRKDS